MAARVNRLVLGSAGLAVIAAAWIAFSFGPAPAPEPETPAVEPSGDSTAAAPAPANEPEAAAAPDAAAAEPPDGGTDLNRRAMNAWRTGDIKAAMALFEQAIAASPDDPAPHSQYGRLLTLMVSYDRAIPLLERARDLAPGDAQAWLDLATAYERAQRFDDAWAARAEAARLVGAGAITRDEQGRFVVAGTSLW